MVVTNQIFHLSYFFPSLNFTIFRSLISSHTVLSTLLIPAVMMMMMMMINFMQDACHNELSKYDLARHESSSSSEVRALDCCTGGHGFDSRQGLKFILCLMLVKNEIFHLSCFRVAGFSSLPSFVRVLLGRKLVANQPL